MEKKKKNTEKAEMPETEAQQPAQEAEGETVTAAQLEELQKQLDAKAEELAALNDKYLRLAAEYDNFRKRSAKERESVYADACADTVSALLPVYDNLERAAQYKNNDAESVAKGLEMTLKSFTDALTKLGVTEIPAETFDPNVHNAVMHVDDENLGENVVADVFQAGFKLGEKVIRFAMVKVAN